MNKLAISTISHSKDKQQYWSGLKITLLSRYNVCLANGRKFISDATVPVSEIRKKKYYFNSFKVNKK
jgi:hypothetical protein